MILLSSGHLTILFIAVIHCVIGFSNAFQIPAVSIVAELLTISENYTKASGMLSFLDSLVVSFSSAIATILFSSIGIQYILIFDIITYVPANILLLFFVKVPESEYTADPDEDESFGSFVKDTKEGFAFILGNRGLLKIILSLCFINFFSRITYENILPAMLLSRSNSEIVLGAVNGIIGIGGILGSLIVRAVPMKRNKAAVMYGSILISFLAGDLFMAFGRNLWAWIPAAIAASLPIPFMVAAQRTIIYTQVPRAKQGRIFATKNAIQHCLIPVGILMGGALADHVFEPFLVNGTSPLQTFLFRLFGATSGSGMAMMFSITGILGAGICIFMLKSKDVRKLGEPKEAADFH